MANKPCVLNAKVMNLNPDLTNWKRFCANLLPENMSTRLIAPIFLLLALAEAAFAQTSEETEIRFYDVEVIIFKNLRGPKGKELILPVSSPRKDANIMDLSSPDSIRKANEKSYEVLQPSDLRMTDKVAKIEKSPYYDLLLHVGWRQPGLAKEDSLPVWVRGGRVFGDEFVSIDSQLTALAADSFRSG